VIHTLLAPYVSRPTLEPQNLEHLPLPLNPFEFPRPFEVFEGGCFLNKASSQMASNTLFWKRERAFEVFEGGRVFAKT